MNRSRAGVATIALFALSLSSFLLAGCGDDYEPHLHGEGEFMLSGDIETQLNCKVRWVKKEHAGGGGNFEYDFTSPGIVCEEEGEDRFFMNVILWHDADGAIPDVEEGTYHAVSWGHDCPMSGPPCSAGQLFREDTSTLLTVADEGEFVLNRVEDGYISGSIDALFTPLAEESSETVRIVGDFTAGQP